MAQREHGVAARSGRIGSGPGERDGIWRGGVKPYRELGVDSRWEHSIVVVNAEGKIIEEWTQWDKLFKRPHAVYISPYDAEKHVWVVDDHTHAIYKFTNDGKQLVQRIGTPKRQAPTALTSTARPSWRGCPMGASMGRMGTMARASQVRRRRQVPVRLRHARRVREGTRPGNMNNVHGVAVDLETDGRRQRSRQPPHSDLRREGHVPLRVEDCRQPLEPPFRADRRRPAVVAFDRNTHKMLNNYLDGRLSERVGNSRAFPGTLWGRTDEQPTRKATSMLRRLTRGDSRILPAGRCEPGLPDWQTGLLGVEVSHAENH